jgi:benzoate/toluate 1,2-dioxygenase subunit beta
MGEIQAHRRDDVLARCAQFVYEEAELLDSMRIEQWLDLFDETSVYWLPIDTTKTNPLDTLNLIYDDRPRLSDRVARLKSGFAFSEVPESRTSHVISNVRLVDEDEFLASVHDDGIGGDELAVAGRGTIARMRHGACDLFHARMVWVLAPAGHTFKIKMKRVDLLNASEPLVLMTFLV